MGDEKKLVLQTQVREVIDSSLGMAMIYTVAESIQDFLKQHNQKELSMHEEMMKRQAGEEGGEATKDEDAEEGDDDDEEEDGPNPEEEWKGLAEKTLCAEA